MDLSYVVYRAEENDNERFSAARKAMGFEERDVYFILNAGEPWIIQAKGGEPYPGETMDEAAQNHIAELLRQEENVPEAEEADG
jgi:hypothetical protein